jgi:hypothetical protein
MFNIEDVPTPTGSQNWVPGDLDQIPPGPILAGWLSSVDVNELSGFDRVLVLRAHHRMANHYMAHTYRDMAAVTDALRSELDDASGEVALAAEGEIRAALTWTRRLAESELSFALELRNRLPRLFMRLQDGSVDVRKAKAIVDGTLHLEDDAAARITDQVLDQAASLTTGQLRARLRRLCIESDPEAARNRFETALASRRLTMQPTPDGTAHLFAFDLPPDTVSAAMRRIEALARAARSADDPRSADQIRADVFVDLLAGREASVHQTTQSDSPKTLGKRGTVDIRVDLATLIGLNNNPGHLGGYGPVIADIARTVTEKQHDATWRYAITDPESGRLVASGTTQRRPTVGQRRTVEALDPTCIFPGCRMPATDSDLDHTRQWANGGPTTIENLAPLCRHDHRIKHEAGWSYERTECGGANWITRLGHSYTTALPPP